MRRKIVFRMLSRFFETVERTRDSDVGSQTPRTALRLNSKSVPLRSISGEPMKQTFDPDLSTFSGNVPVCCCPWALQKPKDLSNFMAFGFPGCAPLHVELCRAARPLKILPSSCACWGYKARVRTRRQRRPSSGQTNAPQWQHASESTLHAGRRPPYDTCAQSRNEKNSEEHALATARNARQRDFKYGQGATYQNSCTCQAHNGFQT